MSGTRPGSEGGPPDSETARYLWSRVADDLVEATRTLSQIRDHPGLTPGLHDLVITLAGLLGRIAGQLAELQLVTPGAALPSLQLDVPMLSPREREVLLLIVEGLSNREIADRLGVGSATAKSHVQRLLAKLQVDNRTQAAILAVRLELLEPPM